jgi:hypothetical protein
MSQEEMNKGH